MGGWVGGGCFQEPKAANVDCRTVRCPWCGVVVPCQLFLPIFSTRASLTLKFLASAEVAPTEAETVPVGPTTCPEKQAYWLLPVQTTIENVHSWEECGEKSTRKALKMHFGKIYFGKYALGKYTLEIGSCWSENISRPVVYG